MGILRIVTTPAFLLLVVVASVVLRRLIPGERTDTFWIVGMTTFGAIEIVTLGILALRSGSPRALMLAHALNAAGALLMGYSGLIGNNVVAFVSGSMFFVAGMLLWRREMTLTP